MCMNPEISVIIPVYNVERYLEECVASVRAQSFRDFEILLIDDGSTDSSGKICDALKEKDERIRVFHKSNAGPSHTRNVGIAMARGAYVTYIDSDDTVHPDYLKMLLSLIKDYRADISSCEFLSCEEGSLPEYAEDAYEHGCLSGREALRLMLCAQLHGTSACGLLIRKDLAETYEFPLGKYHEDDMTTYRYFMHAETLAYTKQPLYTYYQRQGSIMHQSFGQIDVDELEAGDRIYEDCSELGADFAEAALARQAENYYQVIHKYPGLEKKSPETDRRIRAFIRSKRFALLSDRYIGKRRKTAFILYEMKLLNLFRGTGDRR